MTERNTSRQSLKPKQLARRARLRYVTDEDSGYSRQSNGQGFIYLNCRGRRLRDQRQIERIEQLAIPPAWRDVWICRLAAGHLQATGRDQRGRKQYLYHERWREASIVENFRRLRQFGRALPRLRRTLRRELKGRELTRQRVLAGVVALLDATSIRVGNEEYVKENNSYGLTTLRSRHVTISRSRALLQFRGKGGLRREAIIDQRPLVRLIQQCRQLPGARLFQYVDEHGKAYPASAADVNSFLQQLTNNPFTAKDFRTWKASARAAEILLRRSEVDSISKRRKIVREAIAEAAESLGNTPTICRKYYVHPGLVESYEQGDFPSIFAGFTSRRRQHVARDDQILARFLRSQREPSARDADPAPRKRR